ncbi:kinase-like domain-containing protein [Chaetomidium leptoderma]|uniref:Kinase-like domain-containing protein n=1 Tax=Chaetomidium leptoderma TaxID=669021 RepID=A0AAN6VE91_9PEZI|nr:kinase-like domain-containing protein [Chaetomidium leptoderma]
MATKPTIPYYAPAELLPAPLPTKAEILASKKRLSAPHETDVFRVGEHYAVKYGRRVNLQEGENMLFVRQSTSIPIPNVYALFTDEATKWSFIVMEYIPGRNLEYTWDKLSPAEKTAIVSQLRQHMDELRSVPSPGHYGGIWGQPIQDFLFQRDPGAPPSAEAEISGPHKTEEQWVNGMMRCLQVGTESIGEREMVFGRRHCHAVFKGHKAVFTHANLVRRNVILRGDGTVVIIDWENAGWYPSFWEYCFSALMLNHRDDWDESLYAILDTYAAELGWMGYYRDLLRHRA